jgi:hypothetical protein
VGEVGNGEVVVYGVDLARSLDFTVVVGMDAYRRVVTLDRWQAPWAVTKTKVQKIVGATPVVADATGVGDAIVSDLQMMGVNVSGHIFTQSSKLRLMQRLVAAFQGKELVLPNTEQDRWLVAELETFEFEYTATGVRYCMDKNTAVLTGDLRWVALGTVQVGDTLAGFSEHAVKRVRRWEQSRVTAVQTVVQPCYRIVLSDGTDMIASADHRWLRKNSNGPDEWIETKDLKAKHPTSRSPRDAPTRLTRLVKTWENAQDYQDGYISGVLDGEGYLNQLRRIDRENGNVLRVTFAQRDNEVAAAMCQYLTDKNFEYSMTAKPSGTNGDVFTFGIVGGHAEVLRLLGSTRPKRLLAKFDIGKMGRTMPIDTPFVEFLEFLGDREVIAITTSMGTFIAEGIATHNCAPSGFHDDGVMALGLALHGWDRVQGVVPEAPVGLRKLNDDPYVSDDGSISPPLAMVPGDFHAQLPASGW